ncbi:MAG: 7,8-didemethyl-8-hydroxy-5-deazariboflavin synthase CofG [Acidobacteria bacterium]|nr:7,8-didemethyl-8-hydroxy-5-deazariboflavin synthase CofG [Acidobacteriota bacterium]
MKSFSFPLQVSSKTEELCSKASELRDRGKGRVLSYSPKVFIPLTRLCRDFCSYCTFRVSPRTADRLYMTPEEVLAVARAGEAHGCTEALFVLGERPEERYPEARQWLKERGFESTHEYLYEMCRLILEETSLFPHSNPGTLTRNELVALKKVNVSLGLMLESTSRKLLETGGAHEHAPSKRPEVRLKTLELAGAFRIPFTTGILVGIGESEEDRIESLQAIRSLHERYGHIQEVIIQNFRAKPHTRMDGADEASVEEFLQTVAWARIILGAEMNVQVPPNLADPDAGYLIYLRAGINDWGGISPVTIDYVNPEAPWPHLDELRRSVEAQGFKLRPRFPVYPAYFMDTPDFLPWALVQKLRSQADSSGYPASAVHA